MASHGAPRALWLLLALGALLFSAGASLGASPQAPPFSLEPPLSPQAAAFAQLGVPFSPGVELGYSASALAGLTSAQGVPASQLLTLGVTLLPRDEPGLSQYVSEVSTPGSPTSGQFLSPVAFDATYAPSATTYAAVVDTFEAAGFTVEYRYADHLFLQVRGTAGEAERLFSTRLETGILAGQPVMSPASVPVLPASLVPYVLTVSGLSEGLSHFTFDARPLAISTGTIYPNYPHFMYGMDNLYNLTGGPHWADSETIGILLWGDGYNPSDLTTFAQQMYPSNEPSFNIDAVNLDGTPVPSASAVLDPSAAPFELTLDMEWSESQAPGATLMPVYVPDGPASNNYSPSDADLENGLSYLVNASSVNVISMSFGLQDGSDPSLQASFNTLFQAAAADGVSVFASSGDNGGSLGGHPNACTTTPSVDFPASSPYVTAVGGTAPQVSATLGGSTAPTLTSEPAWSGSTGGFSVSYAAPAWQLVGTAGAAIESEGSGMRGIPDVAGPAADNALYFNSSNQAGMGTSFAAPMWAGLAAEMDALHGSGFGLLTPALYQLGLLNDAGTSPVPYNNITSGSNCFYSAVQGWNAVTGWGSPNNALTLYGDLIHGLVHLKVVLNPTVATPGSTVSFSVSTVSNSGGGVGGIPVTISVYSQPPTLSSEKLLVQDQVTTGGNGVASGSFIVPLTYLDPKILVKASTLSAQAVGSGSALLGVSPLGSLWGPLAPLLTAPVSYGFFALCLGLATVLGWYLGKKVVHPAGPVGASGRPVRRAARPPSRAPPAPPPTRATAAPRPAPATPAAIATGSSATPVAAPTAASVTTTAPPPVPAAEEEMPWTGIATYAVTKRPSGATAPSESKPATEEPQGAATPAAEEPPAPSEEVPPTEAPPPVEELPPAAEPQPSEEAPAPEEAPPPAMEPPGPESPPAPEAPAGPEEMPAPEEPTPPADASPVEPSAENRQRRVQQKKVVTRRKQQEAPPPAPPPPPPAKAKPKRKTSKT